MTELEKLKKMLVDAHEHMRAKTNKKCPKCSSKLYEETVEEIDYPYVCLNCDENFYNFEINE